MPRLIFRVAGAAMLAIGLYAGAALVLGLIPVNADFRPSPERSIPIYVRGNGVHTDIVVPWAGSGHDWREEFPQQGAADPLPFISFSWGDRGFYLETPRWRDLRASVAFVALTGLGKATMRVEFAGLPTRDRGHAILRLSHMEYQRLVDRIRSSFRRNAEGRPLAIPTPDYAAGLSSYYEAFGSYSLVHTCNEWTRETLSAAGVRMPLWSPFYPSIFYQLRQIPPATMTLPRTS